MWHLWINIFWKHTPSIPEISDNLNNELIYRSTKCEYLDGSCLASPRWVSLLVAEIYYPDVSFPNPGTPSQNRNPVKGASPPNVSFSAISKYLTKCLNRKMFVNFAIHVSLSRFYLCLQDYNQLFLKRQGGNGPITSGSSTTTSPSKCDGQDDLGCYQVRLYYDWFLIPGSCKCWKNDFFDQYTKRK